MSYGRAPPAYAWPQQYGQYGQYQPWAYMNNSEAPATLPPPAPAAYGSEAHAHMRRLAPQSQQCAEYPRYQPYSTDASSAPSTATTSSALSSVAPSATTVATSTTTSPTAATSTTTSPTAATSTPTNPTAATITAATATTATASTAATGGTSPLISTAIATSFTTGATQVPVAPGAHSSTTPLDPVESSDSDSGSESGSDENTDLPRKRKRIFIDKTARKKNKGKSRVTATNAVHGTVLGAMKGSTPSSIYRRKPLPKALEGHEASKRFNRLIGDVIARCERLGAETGCWLVFAAAHRGKSGTHHYTSNSLRRDAAQEATEIVNSFQLAVGAIKRSHGKEAAKLAKEVLQAEEKNAELQQQAQESRLALASKQDEVELQMDLIRNLQAQLAGKMDKSAATRTPRMPSYPSWFSYSTSPLAASRGSSPLALVHQLSARRLGSTFGTYHCTIIRAVWDTSKSELGTLILPNTFPAPCLWAVVARLWIRWSKQNVVDEVFSATQIKIGNPSAMLPACACDVSALQPPNRPPPRPQCDYMPKRQPPLTARETVMTSARLTVSVVPNVILIKLVWKRSTKRMVANPWVERKESMRGALRLRDRAPPPRNLAVPHRPTDKLDHGVLQNGLSAAVSPGRHASSWSSCSMQIDQWDGHSWRALPSRASTTWLDCHAAETPSTDTGSGRDGAKDYSTEAPVLGQPPPTFSFAKKKSALPKDRPMRSLFATPSTGTCAVRHSSSLPPSSEPSDSSGDESPSAIAARRSIVPFGTVEQRVLPRWAMQLCPTYLGAVVLLVHTSNLLREAKPCQAQYYVICIRSATVNLQPSMTYGPRLHVILPARMSGHVSSVVLFHLSYVDFHLPAFDPQNYLQPTMRPSTPTSDLTDLDAVSEPDLDHLQAVQRQVLQDKLESEYLAALHAVDLADSQRTRAPTNVIGPLRKALIEAGKTLWQAGFAKPDPPSAAIRADGGLARMRQHREDQIVSAKPAVEGPEHTLPSEAKEDDTPRGSNPDDADTSAPSKEDDTPKPDDALKPDGPAQHTVPTEAQENNAPKPEDTDTTPSKEIVNKDAETTNENGTELEEPQQLREEDQTANWSPRQSNATWSAMYGRMEPEIAAAPDGWSVGGPAGGPGRLFLPADMSSSAMEVDSENAQPSWQYGQTMGSESLDDSFVKHEGQRMYTLDDPYRQMQQQQDSHVQMQQFGHMQHSGQHYFGQHFGQHFGQIQQYGQMQTQDMAALLPANPAKLTDQVRKTAPSIQTDSGEDLTSAMASVDSSEDEDEAVSVSDIKPVKKRKTTKEPEAVETGGAKRSKTGGFLFCGDDGTTEKNNVSDAAEAGVSYCFKESRKSKSQVCPAFPTYKYKDSRNTNQTITSHMVCAYIRDIQELAPEAALSTWGIFLEIHRTSTGILNERGLTGQPGPFTKALPKQKPPAPQAWGTNIIFHCGCQSEEVALDFFMWKRCPTLTREVGGTVTITTDQKLNRHGLNLKTITQGIGEKRRLDPLTRAFRAQEWKAQGFNAGSIYLGNYHEETTPEQYQFALLRAQSEMLAAEMTRQRQEVIAEQGEYVMTWFSYDGEGKGEGKGEGEGEGEGEGDERGGDSDHP
ncbi:hypothetical protein DFH06DRAFT_1139187 [Mycena polygramma]|nr:hypothetical protein DFH06DRAFT_1139187 [Mycena polygramma]